MLLLNLTLLIDVTFSTPTGRYTQNPCSWHLSAMRVFRQPSTIRSELTAALSP